MNPRDASPALEGLIRRLPASGAAAPGWLARLRAQALERAGALSLPTARDEDWRFTDISPLAAVPWQPVEDISPLAAEAIAPFAMDEAAARLVFVDGIYVPSLSFNASDLVVENLAAALSRHGAEVEAHLGRHAEFDRQLFAALNLAHLRDGAVVIAPPGAASAAPVHLLFAATGRQAASHPRCLIVAEADSAMTVVEDFVALQPGAGFRNAVTEVALAPRARVDHLRIQRESTEAFHIATAAVALEHASRYRSTSVTLGGRISRYGLEVRFGAEGAECDIDGLALVAGRQLADTHTLIDHARPNCTSRQLHKCIADGAAHAVFNGRILVRPGAQQTDSSQSSRNLLLSRGAHVDTKPQLEIFADGVKCAHGATVGQLDEDELFYLRSRGLSEGEARNLLTYAFGAEVIRRISIPSLERRLEQALLSRSTH